MDTESGLAARIAGLEALLNKIPDLREPEVDEMVVLTKAEIIALREMLVERRKRALVSEWILHRLGRLGKAAAWVLGLIAAWVAVKDTAADMMLAFKAWVAGW